VRRSYRYFSRWCFPFAAFACAIGIAASANAWFDDEHRDIGVAALGKLPADERAVMEQLWADAKSAFRGPLCARISEGDQGGAPRCIDFPALPALAGDHSCSPADLVTKVLPHEWVLDVAAVAAETKAELAAATSRQEHLNIIAGANFSMQAADSQYVTRAGSNNAHFLRARSSNDVSVYAARCVQKNEPLNALGLYLHYHTAALALAQEFGAAAPGVARARMARDVLALEAYALHWLEDIHAAGHMVGSWGDMAWRKGTHDYYNEFGLDTRTWSGTPFVAFGDSHMRSGDRERSAAAVAQSLHELTMALRPGDALGILAAEAQPTPEAVFGFDSCRASAVPPRGVSTAVLNGMLPQLQSLPVPGHDSTQAHLPRFREELGVFLGAFAGAGIAANWGRGALDMSGDLAAGARLGFGAEGITGSVGTGIAFLEAGIAMQTAQFSSCARDSDCDAVGTNAVLPRVPARLGLRLGLRLPFYLIPGDMLILAPLLALIDMEALSNVSVAAASGGLIPYEQSFRTSVGTFQLVIGREVSAVLFGYLSDITEVVRTGTAANGDAQLSIINARSIAFMFPVLEWTPFRSFATDLTLSVPVHLGFGVEVPLSHDLLASGGGGAVTLPTTYSIYLRLRFDARSFLGTREDVIPLHTDDR
jgi:hypothetical protein